MSLKSLGKRKQVEPEIAQDDFGALSLSETESDLPEINEDEDLLQELLDEEELERELAEEEDAESEDGSDLSDFIARHSRATQEDTPGTSPESTVLDFAKQRRVVESDITGIEKNEWDEIDPERLDSDDEGPENRVGNIPDYFYEDMPHVGYDIQGKKVMRPLKGDELDKFLATVDGSAWTSIMDKTTQQNVELTDEELDLIQRLARSENPDANYDPYEPTVEWFSSKTMETALSGKPEPKRRFIPSKWEHKKVMKIVAAIRQGRILPRKPPSTETQYYSIWTDNDADRQDHPMHLPAPKMAPPSHAESYNPPAEYLFTDEERQQWLDADPSDRLTDFIPAKYASLRTVPAFKDFMQQRFNRCLDLYMAPRTRRKNRVLKNDEEAEELKPQLPSPNELKPYPLVCSVTYVHPENIRIRCVAVDPTGNWVVTGAEDGCVRLWELKTGRCARLLQIGRKSQNEEESDPVMAVEWCAVAETAFFVVATENKLTVIALLDLISTSIEARTTNFLNEGFTASLDGLSPLTKWEKASETTRESGIWLNITTKGTARQLGMHRKGDYFVSVASDGGEQSVLIHQISKHHTQAPFRKLKGPIERALFHPSKPHLFVATQREIRLYDLAGQSLVKTLIPGLRMISSIDVHPLGDNVIVGSYDKRFVWHDLDLSDRPYKTLRFHSKAIRSVSFSPSHPLFMTASDDATIHVFHASVYTDLVTEPLIVPVRILKGHEVVDSLGVLSAKWHPKEPWLVSVGSDGVGRLWTN